MANFYTQFSTTILGEASDLEHLVAVFDFFGEQGGDMDGLFDQDFLDAGLSLSMERTEFFKGIDANCGGALGCEASLVTDQGLPHVWLRATEGADIDAISKLLQDWLAHTGSREAIQFGYAETADKMHPGAFGGGAVHIRAEGIRHWDTSSWLRDQAAERGVTPEESAPGQ